MDYKNARSNKYKQESKERLSKILKKKIQTTMIGALSTIEEHLGFLWENDENMKNIYNDIRSEILDRGNNQARNIDAELAQYEVEWLRYQLNMPVINPKQ